MTSRKTVLALLSVSMLGSILSYIFDHSETFGLCAEQARLCRNNLDLISEPLFPAMIAFTLVFFILLFVPRSFTTWKKFAIWATPIALLLFATAPQGKPGGIGTIGTIGIGPSAEDVYLWVSVTYVLLSIIVIAFAAFRKNKEKPEYN